MQTFTLKYSIFILAFISTSCGHFSSNPNPIENENADSVIIFYNHPDDTIAPAPRKLSSINAKKFIEKWNDTYPSNHCKYYSNYKLTVYQKHGERSFRISGQNIKEKTDECFDFGDPDYFDNLWKKSK